MGGKDGFAEYAGYSRCLVLENEGTRVVLGPQCGGRVLAYSWKDKDAIILKSEQDGWLYVPGKPKIDPYGGRFDIGPEMTIPNHPVLWLGKWKGEFVGTKTARLTSQVDPAVGVQLIREFRLDDESSHLRCTQTIKNISGKTVEYCHWSRTLAPGGGICVIPLTETPKSRFPNKYVMYGPGDVIVYRPKDPKIKVVDGFLIITGVPAHPKLGIDSYAGWFAYLMRNGLLFIKKFPVYPDKVYNEIAAITISIYYTSTLCELEPIGPREIIRPGASASYTEDWRLLDYPFPSGLPDSRAVEDFVRRNTG